jgi:oxygen-dependent protoporphyrinogen oxidase
LPRRLADRLGPRIQLGVAVGQVRASPDQGGFELAIRHRSEERRLTSRALVLALPPEAAASMLRGPAPEAASALAEIESPPLAVVSVALSRSEVPHPLRGFGFLAARGAGVRILGCVWPSSIFPGRAPDAQLLLTCFVGGATDADAAALDDATLIEIMRRDLEKTLHIHKEPRVVATWRHARSIPQYTVGHGARVTRVRGALERVPGLFLAGNALAGISVGDVIEESGRVASRVAALLRPRNAVDFPALRV